MTPQRRKSNLKKIANWIRNTSHNDKIESSGRGLQSQSDYGKVRKYYRQSKGMVEHNYMV